MIHFSGMAELVNEYILSDLRFDHKQPRVNADVPVGRTTPPACSLHPYTGGPKAQTRSVAYLRQPRYEDFLAPQSQPRA
jgi:hypothetical protein